MREVVLGAGILAAVQLTGALINQWVSSRSEAREMWEWLAIANFWWVIGPYTLIQDERRRRRRRRADLARRAAREERIP